uniref:DUF5641 domain-containing protein n=1 Tax=Meloidogyne javanica TaxID=6303 RepID=A0A915MR56_MELJA
MSTVLTIRTGKAAKALTSLLARQMPVLPVPQEALNELAEIQSSLIVLRGYLKELEDLMASLDKIDEEWAMLISQAVDPDRAKFEKIYEKTQTELSNQGILDKAVEARRGLLEGEALNLVRYLTPSADNYQIAIDLLTERYDDKETLTGDLIQRFHALKPCRTFSDVRQFQLELELICRQLESLGAELDNPIICSSLENKLSYAMLREIKKIKRNCRPWNTSTFRTKLKELVKDEETNERAYGLQHETRVPTPSSSPERSPSPKATVNVVKTETRIETKAMPSFPRQETLYMCTENIVFNPDKPEIRKKAIVIWDSCCGLSYITDRLAAQLQLPIRSKEKMEVYRAFSSEPLLHEYEVSPVSILANDDSVAQAILENIYVDNIVIDVPIGMTPRAVVDEACDIFKDAQMNLREISSNDRRLIESLPAEKILTNRTVKLLGIPWDTVFDWLLIKLPQFPEGKIATKREVLSILATPFDPLGLICPVLLPVKIFMNDIWSKKLKWDDRLSDEQNGVWQKLMGTWKNQSFTLDRRLFSPLFVEGTCSYTLHAFTDASGKAFGVCVYLVRKQNDLLESKLIMAKSSIKPAKLPKDYDTIPKLELQAAKLGIKLLTFLLEQLQKVTVESTFLWVDALDIIHWLKSDRKLDRYVENRLGLLRKYQVRRVPGKENPADIASRGMEPEALNHARIWWQGPSWLKLACEEWPETEYYDPADVPEAKEQTLGHLSLNTQTQRPTFLLDLQRFGYNKLALVKRIVALVLRLCRKNNIGQTDLNYEGFRHMVLNPGVTVRETKNALKFLIREAQYVFPPSEEVQARLKLTNHRKDGIWRCEGRIENSQASKDAQSPIWLPREAQITRLIVQEAHVQSKHAAVATVTTIIRQHYWIDKCRKLIERIIYHNLDSKCYRCARFRAQPYQTPQHPPLPTNRVKFERPFENVGLDYFGPNEYRTADGLAKYWGAIYTCMATRAIALDVVTDCTAFAFLNSFRRFVAQWDCPLNIYSDNALQFKLASQLVSTSWTVEEVNRERRIEKRWEGVFRHNSVQNYMVNNGVTWHFIIERAPWKGPYERLIGPVKYCLKRSLAKSTKLNLDEIRTLLAEISKVVNERPVSFRSERDLIKPLRPIDILLPWKGHATIPSLNPETRDSDQEYYPQPNSKINLEKMLLASRKQLEHFRKSWIRHYLLSLRERSISFKNSKHCQPPQVGDVVLVFDPDHDRKEWRLALILELFQDQGGTARSAKINMGGFVTNRAISHLYPIEVNERKETETLAGATFIFPFLENLEDYVELMDEVFEENGPSPVARNPTTGGVMLNNVSGWSWGDVCEPGAVGHEECDHVRLQDLAPRRVIGKGGVELRTNFNMSTRFTATTLLLMAIVQSILRTDQIKMLIDFIKEVLSAPRQIITEWYWFQQQYHERTRRKLPRMEAEDWNRVIEVRSASCRWSRYCLHQNLERPAHIINWEQTDWTKFATGPGQRIAEEYVRTSYRPFQHAINIYRHKQRYGVSPILRFLTEYLILGDDYNIKLKARGVFTDKLHAFHQYDFSKVQIGPEILGVILNTGNDYLGLRKHLQGNDFRTTCCRELQHFLEALVHRGSSLLIVAPILNRRHLENWRILKEELHRTATTNGHPYIEPMFSREEVSSRYINDNGEPTEEGLDDLVRRIRSQFEGFPSREQPRQQQQEAPVVEPSLPPAAPRRRRLDVQEPLEPRQQPQQPPVQAEVRLVSNLDKVGPEVSTVRTGEISGFKRAKHSYKFQPGTSMWDEVEENEEPSTSMACSNITAKPNNDNFDFLSQEIEFYYFTHQQTNEERERKERVFKIIKEKLASIGLARMTMTGSSSTGMAANNADLDISILTDEQLYRGGVMKVRTIWSRITPSATLTVMTLLSLLTSVCADTTPSRDNQTDSFDTILWIGVLILFGTISKRTGYGLIWLAFARYACGTSLAEIPGNALLCSKIKSYWRIPTVSCADIQDVTQGKNVTLDIFDKVRLPYPIYGGFACRKFRDTVQLYQNVLGDKFPENKREFLPITSGECRDMREKKKCTVGTLTGGDRVFRTSNILSAEYPGKWESWWTGPRNYTTENCELLSTDLFRMGTNTLSSPVLDVQHCNYKDGFCNLNDSLLVWHVECQTSDCEPCSYKYGWSWFGKAWKNEFIDESGENSLTWSGNNAVIDNCGEKLIVSDEGFAIRKSDHDWIRSRRQKRSEWRTPEEIASINTAAQMKFQRTIRQTLFRECQKRKELDLKPQDPTLW